MMRVGNDGALTYAYNAQAATSEDGVIVAVGLTTSVADTPQAVPMVAAVQTMTGTAPGCAVMDKGYLSEANLGILRAQGQRCLIAVGREGKRARWPRGSETQRMHRLLRLPWARRRYGKRKTQGERPFAESKQAMRFRRCQLRGRAKVWGEWNQIAAACNLRRLFALGGRGGLKRARGRLRPQRLPSSRVPRLPRQLSWPRHAGRAGHQPFHPRVRSRPEMYLGSAS